MKSATWYILDEANNEFVPACMLCMRFEHPGKPCNDYPGVADYWRKRAIQARTDADMFDKRAVEVEAMNGGAA